MHAALCPSSYGSLLSGLMAPLLLGFTPAGARIVAWVAQPFGHWLAEALLGSLVILMMVWLLSVPFAAWRHTVLRDYGLSTQTWGGWAVDLLKSCEIGVVTGAVVLAGFCTLTRFAPGWWWTFGAVGAAALVVLLSFVFPVLVEPVFNRFTPMPAGPQRDELVMMAARDGMPVRDVLVADASRWTTGLNATCRTVQRSLASCDAGRCSPSARARSTPRRCCTRSNPATSSPRYRLRLASPSRPPAGWRRTPSGCALPR
jgi:STE24 endopeptidase